jgi:drug/metabolite transporter (DMT)-like permease
MFKGGDNFIGVLLLVLCLVVAGLMIWSITSGEDFEYNGPNWLAWGLAALFTGAVLYGLYQGFVRKSGREWPNPQAGRRSLWDRIRGRGEE